MRRWEEVEATTISPLAQHPLPLAQPGASPRPQPQSGNGQAPVHAPLGDGDGDHGIEPGGGAGQRINIRG
jgi:hypothetical protein